MKRLLALILCFLIVLSFSACAGAEAENGEIAESGSSSAEKTVVKKPEFVSVGENGSRTDDKLGFQVDLQEKGEKIAVLDTNMGIIKMRLFPESAPIAVTNFIALAESGFYDGLTFHHIADGFMIQGGDPDANGMGGNSIWGDRFQNEINYNLRNIRGAVFMASVGDCDNGSQFAINQSKTAKTKADLADDAEKQGDTYPLISDIPDEVFDLYAKYGGSIYLDGSNRLSGGFTVFAQVFEGMDVVDAIAGTEVDQYYRPIKRVVINKVTIEEY